MNWLIKNFLRGLVIVVPIALTVYLLYQTFVWLDRLLHIDALKLDIPGLGVAILFGLILLVGVLAGNFVGRRIVALTEKMFTKAPIVRIVYAAIKDLLEAFVGNKRRFDTPVSIELANGIRALGFITRDDLGSIGTAGEVGVYVPFSYTWDGCMLVVSRERLTPLNADSASVLALVVSGGVSRV
jgi:uncharacterized membrane protein